MRQQIKIVFSCQYFIWIMLTLGYDNEMMAYHF